MARASQIWSLLRSPIRINPGWIGPSQTSYATVDLSSLLPPGTVAIRGFSILTPSGGSGLATLRLKVASGDTEPNSTLRSQTKFSTGVIAEVTRWEIMLSSMTLQVRFRDAWTATTNEAWIEAIAKG